MTDFFHEFQWQGRHMHAYYFSVTDGQTFCPVCGETYKPKEKKKRKPLSAPFVAAWMMIRRIQNEEQERLNSLTTNTTTTNKVTLPQAPKPQVSRFAQFAFSLIFGAVGGLLVAFGFALASIMVGVIVGIVIAGFCLLTSISLGILSLRENL